MNIGKVYNYNGISGNIVTENDIYLFTFYGVEKEVRDGELVAFTVGDKENKVAVDVRPYKKVDLKALMKDAEVELMNR